MFPLSDFKNTFAQFLRGSSDRVPSFKIAWDGIYSLWYIAFKPESITYPLKIMGGCDDPLPNAIT